MVHTVLSVYWDGLHVARRSWFWVNTYRTHLVNSFLEEDNIPKLEESLTEEKLTDTAGSPCQRQRRQSLALPENTHFIQMGKGPPRRNMPPTLKEFPHLTVLLWLAAAHTTVK